MERGNYVTHKAVFPAAVTVHVAWWSRLSAGHRGVQVPWWCHLPVGRENPPFGPLNLVAVDKRKERGSSRRV